MSGTPPTTQMATKQGEDGTSQKTSDPADESHGSGHDSGIHNSSLSTQSDSSGACAAPDATDPGSGHDSGIHNTSSLSTQSDSSAACAAPADPGPDTSTDDDESLNSLLTFMKDKLKIGSEPSKVKAKPFQVLSSLDIDGIVEYIKSGKCKKIITMAGAGISTSAGIPDFRSKGSGLYSNLQKYDLPYPEAIFELRYFCKKPQPFFTLAKELYPGSFDPTPSHYFIKLLEEKGLLLRHYTQNIDTLEHVAGISEEKLIEAHGSFRTARCLRCKKKYNQDWVKEKIFTDLVPSCEGCGGIVKPDIVFFGEDLPPRFFKDLSSDFAACDLLIIMGTSLTVQPFASLVDNVPKHCPRLLINRESVGNDSDMLATLQGLMGRQRRGLQLHSDANTRDVAMLGDCDDGCIDLARRLGWKEELDHAIAAGKKKNC